jgi:hypothetical protein
VVSIDVHFLCFCRHQEGELRQARTAYSQVKEQLEKSTSNMQTVLSELEATRKAGLNSSHQVSGCGQGLVSTK